MTLPAGTRIGHYEVQASLGAGGMGEVYRARDTKLDRDVAIKILAGPFAADPARVARFRREAQVLASLNHAHIAAIYGVEEADDVTALVLELVEGPTLANRIAKGAMPVEEALPVARQIIDALEAAHAQGIIHRDLKPANIKLRPDGVVKVLDFGLAKALIGAPSVVDPFQSPTVTSAGLTSMGVILGTAAYMSPEQATGRPVDKRSDIWSFGCVLFEMLVGRRAFDGESVTEILALVLRNEPAWRSLPANLPLGVHRLLRRCLVTDPRRRLADIADARLDLDENPEAAAARPSHAARSFTRWLPWGIAAACLAATIWLGIALSTKAPANTHVLRSSLLLPGTLGGRWGGTSGANLALSPDGRRLVFIASDATGRRQLWIRTLDDSSARLLADTEGAISPFWSPDSRWLAFVADGKLKKIDPAGGPAVTLCESALNGGAWSQDGTLLFTGASPNSLARVPAAGGTPSIVTKLEPDEHRHIYPLFLPDGRRFVYVVIGLGNEVKVYLASLDSEKRTRLPLESPFLSYSQGLFLFQQGSTLMAQPFDESRQALEGAAVPVAERVRMDYTPRGRYFSASTTGVLVFQEDPFPGSELVWHDREGRRTATLGAPADYTDVSLSPDGRRAAVSIAEPGTTNRDLWIFDVARGLGTRFTATPVPETHCVWSPDGSRIVFDSRRKGHRDFYQKASNGSGDEEVLLEDEFDKSPMSWSPDGRFIMHVRRTARTANLWVLPVAGDKRAFPFRETPFFEVPGMFSPDGRWVAYGSNESGQWEVYISPFPGGGEKWRISTRGGFDPRWRRDGRELFYLSPDDKLMVAAISMDRGHPDVESVEPLFDLPKVGPRLSYDVSPDGQRILAVTRKTDGASAPLTLLVNWPALLDR